jgi:hypothetical protein
MTSRYLTWQHGGGLIVGDGMTGLIPPSTPAGPQAISHTDPTPTRPEPD